MSKLVAITALALCWAYQAGLTKVSEQPNHYKRRPKANGRTQASIFAIGLIGWWMALGGLLWITIMAFLKICLGAYLATIWKT